MLTFHWDFLIFSCSDFPVSNEEHCSITKRKNFIHFPIMWKFPLGCLLVSFTLTSDNIVYLHIASVISCTLQWPPKWVEENLKPFSPVNTQLVTVSYISKLQE